MIDYILNFVVISFSMYIINESIRKSLRSLDLIIFIAKNARSIVVVETVRVSTSITTL